MHSFANHESIFQHRPGFVQIGVVVVFDDGNVIFRADRIADAGEHADTDGRVDFVFFCAAAATQYQ